MRKKHIGSTLDSFLEEAGIKEEVYLKAKKTILVDQLRQLMKKRKLTKADLARRMRSSRIQVDRLLDADNTGVTLATVSKVTRALEADFSLVIEDRKKRGLDRARRGGEHLGSSSPGILTPG